MRLKINVENYSIQIGHVDSNVLLKTFGGNDKNILCILSYIYIYIVLNFYTLIIIDTN